MKKFDHGGDVLAVSETLGLSPGRVIDFSASINPLGLSPLARKAIEKTLRSEAHYPEPYGRSFSEKISRLMGLPPSRVIAGNGSTELIYLIPRALRPRRVLIHEPTFSEYERAALASGAAVRKIRQIKFNRQKFTAAMEEGQLAYLCNPNNPTGELIPPETVAAVAEAARMKKCYLVLDEAFMDFVAGGDKSACLHIRGNPYLIVLRSLTKFHALAALRTGFAVMHPAAARRISALREPWSVNSFAMEAAEASLLDAAYQKRTLRFVGKEKKYIEGRLGEMGAQFSPPAANFYLVRIKKAKGFVARMAAKGLLLRDCSNFGGLDNDGPGGYIRFAVRVRRENRMLLDEMEKWIRARRPI